MNCSKGINQEIINESEGEKQKIINKAEREAEKILQIAKAIADGIKQIAQSIQKYDGKDAVLMKLSNEYLLQLKNLVNQKTEMLLRLDYMNLTEILKGLKIM